MIKSLQEIKIIRSFIRRLEHIANRDLSEKIAVGYIFFRNPIQFFFLFGPLITGIIAFFFAAPGRSDKNLSILENLQAIQTDFIIEFLFGAKIGLIMLASFLTVYRWGIIQSDGHYGYWVSTGVNRRKFYFYSIAGFLIYSYLGIIIGYGVIINMGGIHLSLSDHFILFILLFTSTINLFGLAIVTAEIINNALIAPVVFIGISGLNLIFNNNMDNIFNILFLPEFHFQSESSSIALIASLLFGIILMVTGLYFHEKAELEL